MTIIAFSIIFCLAWVHYTLAGPLLWAGGPTVYMTAIYVMMAIAAGFSWRHAKKTGERDCLWAVAILCALVLFGWQVASKIGPLGLIYGWVYAIVSACFLTLGTRRFQHIIGAILMALSIASFLNVLGIFPKRPRTFTGFYYPDLMAYGMHLSFIIIGASAGDGLRIFLGRFGFGRGYSHRVLAWAAHRRQSQEVV